MSTLTVTKNYADSEVLTQTELDTAFASVETWANGNIDSTNLAAGAVTNTNLGAASVSLSKLQNNCVTSAILASDALVSANRAVTANHIQDGIITSDKIVNGTIVASKLEARAGASGTASSPNFLTVTAAGPDSTTSTTYSTICSGTLTSIGRPVVVFLSSNGTDSYLGGSVSGDGVVSAFFRITVDGSSLWEGHVYGSFASTSHELRVPPMALIMTGQTGTSHTYALQYKAGNGFNTAKYSGLVLYAYEI